MFARLACLGVAVVVAVAFATPVGAAPEQFPDLSGFTVADVKDYSGYYIYPTTNGVQFTAPAGYRCRITYTGRANPPFRSAKCWGALPGTSSNVVGVSTGVVDDPPAAFGDVDPAVMDEYDTLTPDVRVIKKSFGPDDYKPLPPGSRLDYAKDEVCGVTEQMTACRVGDHGFVLDPQGSWTF
ncbi:hypothetical protein KIH27_09695 [Mycobacterium sp. M1]|uniref:Secreted protein n=1 Tax=Mycolicibacter acidiphilus TaxID=2835306 RepID=A0ABS5RK36_9MYCO|nr:hypothetical protein [Mycolicibacter acidiphilus]MBS9533856.1 hypothetical protein [Mycolicibacter acidiphilus]